MPIDFPSNTVVLIVAAMIGTGAGSWFILSQGLEGPVQISAFLDRMT